VPYLQDIPVLGWLFQGSEKRIVDRQLLVFITPTLVDV
jgi:type II secretory pathway component HofQ